MAKLPIDLSKFKKSHSDKDSTTLVHPEGHSIKLAHKMLSPKMRGQLAALPMSEGGDPTQEHLLPGDKLPNSVEKEYVNESKARLGGKKQKMADGGEPEPKPSFVPLRDDDPTEKRDTDPDNDQKPHKKLDFTYADGGQVDQDKKKTVGEIIGFPGSSPSPSPKPKQYAEGGMLDSTGGDQPAWKTILKPVQGLVEDKEQAEGVIPESHPGELLVAPLASKMAAPMASAIEAGLPEMQQIVGNEAGSLNLPAVKSGFQDMLQSAKDHLNNVFAAAQRGEANMDNVRAAQQAYSRAMDIAERHAAQVAKPRMADGGEVPQDDQQAPVVNNINAAPQQPQPPQAPQIDPRVARMRELYNIRVATSRPASMAAGFGPDMDSQLKSSFGPNGEPPADFDATAWTNAEKDFMEESQRKSAEDNAQHQNALEQNQVRARAGLPMIPVPGNEMPAGATVAPKDMSLAGPATQPSQVLPNALQPQQMQPASGGMQQPNIMHGYQQQLGGIQAEAAATGALGQQQAAELQSSIQKQEAAKQQYQANYDKLDQEYHNFIDDYKNQHIDPRHYLNSMGTGQKIETAIGLLLGGFGAAAGQGNAALNFLNKQIDNDIEAQKMEMGKRQNLLTANFRQFGNMRDAAEMTRAMQQGIVANQLQMAAAKAASPLAKARALQAAGQLESNIAPTLNIMAAMRMSGGAGGQPGGSPEEGIQQSLQMLRYFAPDRAKELESRYIPGAGMAAVPVPQEVRDKITAKQNLGSALQRLDQWSQQHSGTLLDRGVVNEGKAMAAEVQSMYRNAINGGVFKEGEQKFIDKIINSDPTAFFNSIRVRPALREVMQTNAMQLHGLHNSVGLQPFQGTPGANTPIANKQYRPKSFKPAGK